MLGGLHIEKAALGLPGELLKGCGWVEMISGSGVYKKGRAESFLGVSDITRTRRAHQVTAASLYRMLLNAYEPWHFEYTLEEWITKRTQESKQFHFWCIVLELQLRIFTLVRSFREHSFDLYLSFLKSLTPWFFVLDRTHYKKDVASEHKRHGGTTNKAQISVCCISKRLLHRSEN